MNIKLIEVIILNYEPRPNSSRFFIPVGRVGMCVHGQQPKLDLCDSVANRPRAMLSRVVCCTTVAKTVHPDNGTPHYALRSVACLSARPVQILWKYSPNYVYKLTAQQF